MDSSFGAHRVAPVASLAIKSVELATGVTLPYVEAGSASGVPVILLHGVTDSWRSWELVLPHLPPSIRAFAPTQRGHGNASKPAGGYRMRDFAADVAAFLDALEIESAVIVGHSMGSTIARHFAAAHPQRTLGLVLVGSLGRFRDNAGVAEYRQSTIEGLTDPIDASIASEFQVSTLARPISTHYLDIVVGESLKVPARVWRACFDGMFDDDGVDDLHRIDAPTLIVWGDRDGMALAADQQLLLTAIKGALLRTLRGAGHALHWEDPKRFAEDLAAFVREFAH